jgi:uncharacterized protein (DUF885 family)
MRNALVALALLLTPLTARALDEVEKVKEAPAKDFNALAARYFAYYYFHYSPTVATQNGLHKYDSELEDYSAKAVQAQVDLLHGFEKELGEPSEPDAKILLANVKSELLALEVIRNWEKNPDNYSSGVTNSIFVIMERPYAPAEVRLRAVVAREQKIPQVFVEARKNLKNPPRIFTEVALEQISGIIHFFENDVPAAFADATDPELKAGFAQSNAAVVKALKSYGAWMKSSLLPRSKGSYRLGAETFRKKLLYEEMVDLPLDKLLEIAWADLHKNQAEFARVAKEVDPSKSATEVLAELATIHPAPDKLLGAFQDTFSSLIGFIHDHKIITIPSEVQPVLEETPPFMRATTFASMDSPGAFETNSTKAYFNVTLAEKDWTPQRVAEHMAAFNVGTIISTAVHEAYPGHYVQFLWQPQFSSTVRKLLGANTNVEGWAHYTEQMMLDEGYAAAAPDATPEQARQARLIRLGQLQDALLRDARFINSIKLQTGEGEVLGAWGIEQAVDLFVKEGYQSRAVGLVETKRGTADATYLYYTLGKLMILKLREDVKAKQGPEFNLQKFHDSFMLQGLAPIPIIRKAMLQDDSPAL